MEDLEEQKACLEMLRYIAGIRAELDAAQKNLEAVKDRYGPRERLMT